MYQKLKRERNKQVKFRENDKNKIISLNKFLRAQFKRKIIFLKNKSTGIWIK